MNTLNQSATNRVLHSRGAIVECPHGHTWHATVSLVSTGQYAVCGQGVTMRTVHDVEPARCQSCARTWRVIRDVPQPDIERIELNTRGILTRVIVATKDHPAVYRTNTGKLVAGRDIISA